MQSIQFPENFVKLIFELRENFTKPSFEHFKVVLSGILIGGPRKTITAGIRLHDLKCHFSNIHRFVGKYKWDISKLTANLFKMLKKYLPISKEFVFVMDNTLVPKYGPKIFGRGRHRDHAAKTNTSQYIMGHNWIILGLLHNCRLFSKWICFPLSARLYTSKKFLDERESYQKLITIATEMVKHIKSIVKEHLTLVADGFFAKKELVKYCIDENIAFISRIRSDAALFEMPSPNPIGRPRKYGKRLPNPRTLGADSTGFQEYRLKLYGETHLLRVKKVVAIWRPAGRLIQVLIVDFDNSKNVGYFFSTDLSLSVERILSLVAARWSIETLFCDLKEHLGMKEWQCRIQGAVVRSVPLSCAAATLLILWSLIEAAQDAPEFWDVQPWETRKTNPSVLDMIHQLKARCISTNIFNVLQKEGITAEKYRQIEQILRRAA